MEKTTERYDPGIKPAIPNAIPTNDVPASVSDILEYIDPIEAIFLENQGLVGNPDFLGSHFGIVPGVMIAEHMRKGLTISIHYYTREFHKVIRPGDRVVLCRENGDTYIIGSDNVVLATLKFNMPSADMFKYFPYREIGEEKPGKDWIPHGDKFRFCDGVGRNEDGTLVGRYTLTNQYIQRDGTIPFWQLEEACAQIMLGAYRSGKGEDSPYGTYAKAMTQGSKDFDTIMSSLCPGDMLSCIGESEEIHDNKGKIKQLRFLYTCYVNGEELFRGNIVGNAISKELWKKFFPKENA